MGDNVMEFDHLLEEHKTRKWQEVNDAERQRKKYPPACGSGNGQR